MFIKYYFIFIYMLYVLFNHSISSKEKPYLSNHISTSSFVPWTSGTNLQRILGDRYKYMPELAPTLDLLTKIKNGTINWAEYEQIFNNILKKRRIENLFTPDTINKVCFLCAEKTAENCHRRLVAEYLQQHFPDIEIVHL